ncbi:MAG: cytochrome c [Acidobacteria bacterium]|nr:cytochrome c [Acidobacteriota bacterium]
MRLTKRQVGPGVVTAAIAWYASAASPALLAQATGEPAGIYEAACAACHGNDGRGASLEAVGFDVPLPDFTDCRFASREPAADWYAVAHEGGPVRAFDRRMPAFSQLLSPSELELAVARAKGFCTDQAWPYGELNLPRALVTEKAYPEDEAVLSTTLASGTFVNEFLYERRIGARSQVEVNVPVGAQDAGRGWHRGLGDVKVALKHVLSHSTESGHILSVAGEVRLPTGKETEGLGKGVTIFEPFVAYGQVLPGDSFVHIQAGAEFPTNREFADKELFWRTALGRSFVEGEFGRTWSPIVELLAARELGDHESILWDVVPQMQVTLSRRQHVMVNAGVRLPINARAGRGPEVLTYLLWDWFDGGFFDGWR